MKCDIIMPIWNQLECTRECIDSIRKNTKYPFALILIDNASNEETREYLTGLLGQKDLEVSIIRNEENLGFLKAVNQGFKASHAPYICLMNNDTVATDGWLTELVNVADSRKDIAIVNPSSNNLGQHPGRAGVDEYAATLRVFRGQFIEMGACLGFCMFFKKGLLQKLGLFDEIYGVGNFEDTEYSRKAESLGYVCVRAKGSYVYHKISRSFKKKKDFEESFRKNQRIFNKRWGKPKRVLYIMSRDHQKLYDWLKSDCLNKARFGNWIWLFLREDVRFEMKEHSNIRIFSLPEFLFRANCIYRILVRKKKFDSIYLDEGDFSDKIRKLEMFHNADVMLMGG